MNKKALWLVSAVLGLMLGGFATAHAVNCGQVFPGALNNYVSGCTIPSGWGNSLEAKLGVTQSTVSSSLDYQINHIFTSYGSEIIASSAFPLTGIASGTYTTPNLTIDQYGRITAASSTSGSGGGVSTSTPNIWTAIQTFTGGITGASTSTFSSTTVLSGTVSSTEKSALILANASGTWGAYGGASACGAGNAVTTISATGATTCSAFLTGNQTITLTVSGDASGTASGATSITDSITVTKIQGIAVTSTAPSAGKVLSYNGTNSDWEPTASTMPSVQTTTKSVYDFAPASTDDIVMLYTETATTLKQVDCVNDNSAGNTVTFNITWGTNRNSTSSNAFTSNQTCTATTTISTPSINGSTTIAAGSIVRAVLSAASSTGVYIDFKY